MSKYNSCKSMLNNNIAFVIQVTATRRYYICFFHKTNPILTKYEKTRVLGQRTKQLNNGAKPMIKVKENIIDSYLIAEMELKEKKIPFIIRRPLANGYSEYWTLEDLEIL